MESESGAGVLVENGTGSSFEEDQGLDDDGEEIPIWVHGEQRWVSGIDDSTTCAEVVQVLLQDEQNRGKNPGRPERYHITERWRGVEQPLDPNATILSIWSAWGTAQMEVRMSLRKESNGAREDGESICHRKRRHREGSSTASINSGKYTLHPKRLFALAAENRQYPATASTDDLLKLVLAQGEIIRRQLRRLKHSEHMIGYLEDKTHRARVRKHGSNYLLETYLKSLPDATEQADTQEGDKNSDSGVVTEGDCEHPPNSTQNPYEEFREELPEESESREKETRLKQESELWEAITKLNKKLLKEEEKIVRLQISTKRQENEIHEEAKVQKALNSLRVEMTKSACEMQHNEIVLEETDEKIEQRKSFLDSLHKEVTLVEQECEMLQALLYSKGAPKVLYVPRKYLQYPKHAKELNTLV